MQLLISNGIATFALMGVVARQSIKNSIVMLVGVVIGTISTLFIYPLDLEFYGNIQFIISVAIIFAPVATLGTSTLSVRFFPTFENKFGDHHGFLGFLYSLQIIALCIFLMVALLFGSNLLGVVDLLGWDPQVFVKDLPYIILFLIFFNICGLTNRYLTNYQRVVVPMIIEGIIFRLIVPAVVLLSYYAIFSKSELKLVLVLWKGLTFFMIAYYTWFLGKMFLRVKWKSISKKLFAEMAQYSVYGVLGSVGTVIAFRIDTVMVAGYTGFEKTGIYTIALFIANILVIPMRSINPLVGAQISKHSTNGELLAIEHLYKKSSLTLLIVGLGFFLLIWWNIDSIFQITPRTEQLMMGKNVVLFIGLAKLLDMAMGLNTPIISYSKYYRWNLLFTILMGGLTIATNLYFIPRIGFVGAAIATLISLAIFNLLKFCFIWIVFRIQPFDQKTLYVILMGLVASGVITLLPTTGWPLINIAIRSTLILIFFAFPVYYFKISEDINREADKYFNIALGWLRR